MKKSEANQEHKSPVVNEKRSHPFAKDDNNINEKENNVGNDNVTNLYNEKRKYDENKKESEVVDVKDYFQLEFVDGEPLFVCHICNEGLDTEA